ncbi:MAG TPA: aspartyl/asparaginyl beta-hydroxylase domain-containing protein [Steroidobacteraceae bacterium]|nr:aspartyl/asparaginyl beta-hydroxylase domain-containing protein [Steroidobacteraceae bacterium]
MKAAEQGHLLLKQGQAKEAELVFRRVLEEEPDHVEALNIVGLAALRDGDIDRALTLLKRAAAVEGGQALTHLHLGRAHAAAFEFDAAAAAYATALERAPALHAARLHLAELHEKRGDTMRAVMTYARALNDAQGEGRWLNAATTPAGLQGAVSHAHQFVRERRLAGFAELMEPFTRQYGGGALRRVDQAVRIHLHMEQPVFPDPRQKPSFLFFPGLPATPYLDKGLIPEIEDLEAATPDIRAELLALLPSAAGRERVFHTGELEEANLRGLEEPPSWNGYYFFRHGERRADNCAACPKTAAALDALPLSRVPGHGPEVLYSVFSPGTHLLPHCGVTNTRVVGHLPLLIPEDCALRVGGEDHHWREGEVVVFDDTYDHEAWNRSGRTRVVMIFDLWNPFLTQAERAVLAELVVAMGEFRAGIEAL